MKKLFLVLLIPALMSGCGDLKLVMGDDSSEEDSSTTTTTNTDSGNDNSTKSGAVSK